MAGTFVYVAKLPECDIHKFSHGMPGITAHYDGKTRMGQWANMCDSCFAAFGIGLGVGYGQQLMQEPRGE